MEYAKGVGMERKKRHFRIGLAVVLAAMILPMSSMAQQIMVGKFKDRTHRGVGRAARSALAKSLDAKGADLFSYSRYLKRARRYGYRKSRAFTRRAMRKLARRLGIDGIVTGKVQRRGGRYWISVYLYGPNGRLWMKKKVTTRRRRPRRRMMGKIAAEIMKHLAPKEDEEVAGSEDLDPTPLTGGAEDDLAGGSDAENSAAVADNGLDTDTGASEATAVGDKPNVEDEAGEEGWGDSLLGSSSGSKDSSSGAPSSTGNDLVATFSSDSTRRASESSGDSQRDVTFSDESSSGSYSDSESSYTSRPAPRSRLRRGKIDNAFLSVGTGIHWRSGLKPLHTTGAFSGMRFQARGFGGALWDKGWLNDIGIGFDLDFSLGLGYKYNDGSDSRFDASQTMWRLEGLYRLSFENPQVPDLVVKLGIGGTHSSISDDAEFGVNASYVGPYIGMDAVWNMVHEQLRVLFSFDVLMASAGGDLDAFAGGFRVFAGFRSIMIGWLQMDLGYELTYYGFDDSGTGSSSDTYHNIILQLGYSLL